MTTDYKTSIYKKKHLVSAINKDYDRSVKEFPLNPLGGNPHTRVSSSIRLSPATGEMKL